MQTYEPHNNEKIVTATEAAHNLMCYYAMLPIEEQTESIRDVMRKVALLAKTLADPSVHN